MPKGPKEEEVLLHKGKLYHSLTLHSLDLLTKFLFIHQMANITRVLERHAHPRLT